MRDVETLAQCTGKSMCAKVGLLFFFPSEGGISCFT